MAPPEIANDADDEVAADQTGAEIDVGDPVFRATPEQIDLITRWVQNGELKLPQFQRSFVWEEWRTIRLLSTIMSRYPAGTLLLISSPPGGAVLPARSIEGAPEIDGVPSRLVLDGQQRVTALYRARYGKGDHRFFISLKHLLTDQNEPIDEPELVEWDEAVQALERSKKRRLEGSEEHDFDQPDWQRAEMLFPIDDLRREGALDDYLDDVSEQHGIPKRNLRRVRDRYISPLRTYAFPVVTLGERTSLAAVVTIFETLNQTSVQLGPFELLTARFWPDDVDLRTLWEDALDEHAIFSEFQVDPYLLLQAICLRARNSAQRSEVLKLVAADVRDNWEIVVRGLDGVLELLKSECGVLGEKWLPYTGVLTPMAAVWDKVEHARGPRRGLLRKRLEQFFWCTVFTANYDQGANSQAGADHARLGPWLDNDATDPEPSRPEAIAEFALTDEQLRSATKRRRALYRGVMALCVRHGAKDFHLAQRLTAERIADRKIDAHHVFPKKWLADHVAPDTEPDLILNQALIDKETNRRIRARPPSEYLADIQQDLSPATLRDILESHLINADKGSALWTDDYAGFIEERLDLVVSEIEEATDLVVARIEGDES